MPALALCPRDERPWYAVSPLSPRRLTDGIGTSPGRGRCRRSMPPQSLLTATDVGGIPSATTASANPAAADEDDGEKDGEDACRQPGDSQPTA